MEETQIPDTAGQPAKPARRDLLNKLVTSLILAVILGLVLSTPGAGFMVGLIIIPQLFLIPLRLYAGIANQKARWVNLGRVAIWLVTIASIFLVHHVREDIHRRYAAQVVAQLEAYAAAHGQYPAHIEDIGISSKELHEKLGYGGYIHENGKPYFFLQRSFVPFSTWSYDFKRHKWSYQSLR